MPIYKTGYETTAGRNIDVSKAKHEVENAQLASRSLHTNYEDQMGLSLEGNVKGALVTYSTPAEGLVRNFHVPILINDPTSSTGQQLLVGDAKPYISMGRDDSGRPRVTNLTEFEQLRTMMATTLLWLNKGPQALMTMGPVMQSVFSRWISDKLTSKLKLERTTSVRLQVLAAYYFQCLFTDAKQLSEQQQRAMIASACRSAHTDAAKHEKMFEDIGVIDGLGDFMVVIKKTLTEAVQFDTMDAATMLGLMASSWTFFSGPTLAMVALEHPPTFAAMLYMSFGQNSYRKAGLTTVSEGFRGPKGGNDFVRTMQAELGLR